MAEAKTRSSGVVVRFNDQRGFGFIKPEDGGDDLFVHHSEINSDGFRALHKDQKVEFIVYYDSKTDKNKAVDVTCIDEAPIDTVRNGGGSRGYNNGGGGGRGFNGYRGGGGGAGECYVCGAPGHMARDCDGGRRGGGDSCYNCGGVGHFARDCTSARSGGGRGGGGGGNCYNCGQSGHIVRDCPNSGAGGGGRGGGNCFSCGKEGHYARDCPTST